MAKSFRELRARMSPEAQEISAKKAQEILDKMPTHFIFLQKTVSKSVFGDLQNLVHRNTASTSIDVHQWGIQDQLGLHTCIGTSGAASGALIQRDMKSLGGILSGIFSQKHSPSNLEGITNYAIAEHH